MKILFVIPVLLLCSCKEAPKPATQPAVQLPESKVEPIQQAVVVECIRPYVEPKKDVEVERRVLRVGDMKIGETAWIWSGIWTGTNRRAYVFTKSELSTGGQGNNYEIRRERGGIVLLRAFVDITMFQDREDAGNEAMIPIISVPPQCGVEPATK